MHGGGGVNEPTWVAQFVEDFGMWELFLDTNTGLCPSLDMHFQSESDAIGFLEEFIIGAVKEVDGIRIKGDSLEMFVLLTVAVPPWLAGVVLANGFWSTTVSIFLPPYAWYLVTERVMALWGIV